MQDVAWVAANSAELLAAGQVPLMKVEINIGGAWKNLSSLDGENYIQGVTVSLGGASMTPNPIEAVWDIKLFNQDSIFLPQHPTSAVKDYIRTGREMKISIGATYSDGDHLWQRVIGYMDRPKFNVLDNKAAMNGGDYMKLLKEREFRFPDNYWGDNEPFTSIPSDGIEAAELYVEADAMRVALPAVDSVLPGWADPYEAAFTSVADHGGFVGKLVTTGVGIGHYTKNVDVATVVAGTEYRVQFDYRRVVGINASYHIFLYQDIGGVEVYCGGISGLHADAWETEVFYFTAIANGALIMRFGTTGKNFEARIDNISVRTYTSYWDRHYQLTDALQKDPYHVTLDLGLGAGPEPIWQAEEDEGWWYEETTERVFFDINKVVAGGEDIVIYYFTAQKPENVIADLLVRVGLYANQGLALAAMGNPDTGIEVDNVWFEIGTTYLDAIKLLCERCDWRFYFEYDGTPAFVPRPTVGGVDFAFTGQEHIKSANTYQSTKEIKNRIVIEGMKQAPPIGRENTAQSELRGEESDATSIDDYGERTLTIKNHLFQDKDELDQMCIDLLAELKDPKWYTDVKVPFNPVPLEIGDTMSWVERLSPTEQIAKTGLIRDIKIDNFSTLYKCELP